MLTVYEELEQGSPEWEQARCGLITASQLNLILTPKLKIADNEKTRSHCYELAAQRLSGFVEPSYIGSNIERGWADEIRARDKYSEVYAPVQEIGGMVRDFGKFKLWASPDGLVGDDGGIETKSRVQKHQIKTITENAVPEEHILQVQACLMVSGRAYWDYISWSGGLPMWVIRVEPDPVVQAAIHQACEAFEAKVQEIMQNYKEKIDSLGSDVIMTDRSLETDVIVR
mgnify:CR=1 FL=1